MKNGLVRQSRSRVPVCGRYHVAKSLRRTNRGHAGRHVQTQVHPAKPTSGDVRLLLERVRLPMGRGAMNWKQRSGDCELPWRSQRGGNEGQRGRGSEGVSRG